MPELRWDAVGKNWVSIKKEGEKKESQNPDTLSSMLPFEQVLSKLSKAIPHILEPEKFLTHVADLVGEIFGATHTSLRLVEEKEGKKKYGIKTSTNLKGEGIISRMNERKQSLYGDEVKHDDELEANPMLKEELDILNYHIHAPLIADGKLLGTLNLGDKRDGSEYSPEDLKLLSGMTDFLASIIDFALSRDTVSNQTSHQRSILDNIASGIITVDSDGKVTAFNQSAQDVLGFKAAQVVGKNVEMLQGNLARLIMDTLRTGRMYKREELHILPENILIGVSTSQLHSPSGEVVGAVAIFADLKKVKQDEHQIHIDESRVFWERFATSMAHEIKNSLVSTKALAQILPEKYEDDEFRKIFSAAVDRDTKKLDDFTERLISFAHLPKTTPQPCVLSELIEDLLSSVIRERKSKGITFVKKLNQSLPPVMADYHQLKDALAEIIINSIEATPEGGKVTIYAEITEENLSKVAPLSWVLREPPKANLLLIQFTDTGCGVPEGDLPQLFNPFFSTKPGKAGLGLAICQRIIENHDGFMDIKSKEGEGTVVSVYLPFKQDDVI